MDRGYLDFERLYRIHCEKAFFVIRAKKGLDYIRHRSQIIDETAKEHGIRSDHIGRLGAGVRDSNAPSYS
ncbi:MAG: hypothetical protein KDN22_05820 [Verrucomicrobiae bacterium]|nr:hypothetical protein [Verrucomicrobiae bacterium]